MTTDLKVYLVNSGVMAGLFTNIDIVLKTILTAVAIGYTCQKWYMLNKNKKDETNGEL